METEILYSGLRFVANMSTYDRVVPLSILVSSLGGHSSVRDAREP